MALGPSYNLPKIHGFCPSYILPKEKIINNNNNNKDEARST